MIGNEALPLDSHRNVQRGDANPAEVGKRMALDFTEVYAGDNSSPSLGAIIHFLHVSL
ncbi:MAG: hypothetical protein ABSE46_19685 [Terracidiphilus sp.]